MFIWKEPRNCGTEPDEMEYNMKPQLIIRRTQHSGVLSDDMWMAHGRRFGDNEVPAIDTSSLAVTGADRG